MNNNQAIWRVVAVTDFGGLPVIGGATQFGFHVHTGECYHIDNEKGIVGLIEDNRLAWTVGGTNPGFAAIHYCVKLKTPKYVSRSHHQDSLFISDAQGVYKMEIATHRFSLLIDKDKVGIVDPGNCILDGNDHIWINDIRGCCVYHFDFAGNLVERLGKREAGFQSSSAAFNDVMFNWIYDLRLGADGNLYVLDSRNYAVRKINVAEKMVTTICGDGFGGYKGDGGDARAARLGSTPGEYFDGPWSLSIDENNNIFIGDTQNHAVRMIDGATNVIKTILPNETCGDLFFEKICSMDYKAGKLYVPDWRKDSPKTLVVAECK